MLELKGGALQHRLLSACCILYCIPRAGNGNMCKLQRCIFQSTTKLSYQFNKVSFFSPFFHLIHEFPVCLSLSHVWSGCGIMLWTLCLNTLTWCSAANWLQEPEISLLNSFSIRTSKIHFISYILRLSGIDHFSLKQLCLDKFSTVWMGQSKDEDTEDWSVFAKILSHSHFSVPKAVRNSATYLSFLITKISFLHSIALSPICYQLSL